MEARRGCSKCRLFHLPCSLDDNQSGQGTPPSLMELTVRKICQNIHEHGRFDTLPQNTIQLIFDELVRTRSLNEENLEKFRGCGLWQVHLGGYPGVRDSWMNVIASQGEYLQSLDISCSDVTDSKLVPFKDYFNLRKLAFNYCDQISNRGLGFMPSLSQLTSLSIKKNKGLTAEGIEAFTNLSNLVNLDLERCSRIHGGLSHLRGLTKLECLNIKYCNSVTDEDMEPLSGLTNLKELKMSCTQVTDLGIAYLNGLRELSHLNLQGCPVTVASLGTISGFTSLLQLNLNRCRLSDDGCEKFSELIQLKDLNLGYNEITNACLIHLKGLINLESLNLDACEISSEGLLNIRGLVSLRSLDLSETDVTNEALDHLSGLHNLENLNLSFTLVYYDDDDDDSLDRISKLTSLKSLNLEVLEILDEGLLSLSSLIGLTHLDLSGCLIDGVGLNHFKCFKNLQSLEICDAYLTDNEMDHIKGLTSLKLLNLSENEFLTDMTLESISGLTALTALNVSGSQVTDVGLRHLTPLKNLRSLYLNLSKVTAFEMRRLQANVLPNLLIFRPC